MHPLYKLPNHWSQKPKAISNFQKLYPVDTRQNLNALWTSKNGSGVLLEVRTSLYVFSMSFSMKLAHGAKKMIQKNKLKILSQIIDRIQRESLSDAKVLALKGIINWKNRESTK